MDYFLTSDKNAGDKHRRPELTSETTKEIIKGIVNQDLSNRILLNSLFCEL